MRLTTKIILLNFAVAFTVCLSLAWLVTIRIEADIGGELKERGHLLAAALAESQATHVMQRNVVASTHAFNRMTHAVDDGDIAYIFLTDFDGKMFAHTFDGGVPEELLKGDLGERELLFKGERIIEIDHPLIEGMPAVLHVGLSQKHMNTLIMSMRQQILSLALIIGLLVFLLSLIIGRYISRPIQHLAEQIQAYGRGENIEVDSANYRKGGVEVGILADNLKQMLAERTQAQAKLQQVNEELEKRVEQRTQELLAAKDMAERANMAKSEFLSRMSHELRTPMNAIMGFSQILETEPLTPDQHSDISEIRKASHHLLDLINEVLDFNRIEAGMMEMSLEPVEVEPLMHECLTMVNPIAEQNSIRLVMEKSAPNNIGVQADRIRLKQVLINLLSNALKYNQEAGTVWFSHEQTSDGHIRILVRDTGKGIPEESRQRIFLPFERLEGAYSGIEGSGIGLTLCKHYVEAMHGDIGLDSTVGSGSTFWVELPQATLAAPNLDEVSPKPSTSRPSGKHQLLYIEDNPANLRLMQNIIRKHSNLTLVDAMTAELGLAMAAIHAPALILLDINLPGMDGYAALQQLRANPNTHDIPVVAITANAMHRDVKRGLEAGFDAYLTKPFDVPLLISTIQGLLESRDIY